MEEAKGLLTTPVNRMDAYCVLSSGLPDWCEMVAWGINNCKAGFQVAARELFIRDQYNNIDNKRDAIFQVGQIREEAGGFLKFHPFFSVDMDKHSVFSDYRIFCSVFHHRLTGAKAFDVKLICPGKSSRFLMKTFVKPNDSLNYKGLKLVLSKMLPSSP